MVMASLYVSPLGSGTKDGSSVANAAAIGQLPDLVHKVGAGGSILLLADQGAYARTTPLTLTAGGTASAPITIKGVDSHGNAMDAQFVGARAEIGSTDTNAGQDVFRLLTGANNLNFENLAFKNVANAVRVGADISNLSITHASAQNVAHFLEDYVSGSNTSATISGLLLDDVVVNGYSKSVVRLQYDTHNVVIKNTLGDSKRIDGGYAVGVELDGTVHDVLLSHVTMQNNVYTGTNYWNGDGFSTEEGVSNVRFDHTVASGNGDAGYDIKSASTILDGVLASGNNRNFRFWNDDTTLMNSSGTDPHHSGGTSSQSQVWLGDDAAVKIINSSFSDTSAATIIFNLDQSHATATLENVNVSMAETAKLYRLYDGSTVQGAPKLGPIDSGTGDHPLHSHNDTGGDGKGDLVFQNADNTVALWSLDGSTITDSGAVLGAAAPAGWHVKGTGDLNGDGKADMLLQQDSDGAVAVWAMDHRYSPAAAVLSIDPGPDWKLLDSADLNGDGKNDLVFQNAATNQMAAWLMDGATIGPAGGITRAGAPTGWEFKASGDLNADGNADLLFQNKYSGAVAVWAMSGTDALATAVLNMNPGPEWKLIGSGDLNGDGKGDLVFQNSASNIVAAWLMDGAAIKDSGAISGAGAPAGWHLQSAQDVNGDGRADLIFQNEHTGSVAEWLMDGLHAQSTALLGIVPGAQWDLIG